MKFKLDENLGRRCQGLFRAAGHDAQTVLEESLSGATDRQIYDACRRERRCLVTLDLDFADVTRFAPDENRGHHRTPTRKESIFAHVGVAHPTLSGGVGADAP